MKQRKMLFSVILCMTLLGMTVFSRSAFALSNFKLNITFSDDYSSEQGHVEYQINDGDWVEVTSSLERNIAEEITSLRFKVVPDAYYEVNFDDGPYLADGTGVAFHAGDAEAARQMLTTNGYEANLSGGLEKISLTGIAFRGGAAENQANISVDIDGPGLEFWNDDIPSRISFSLGDGEIFQFGSGNLVWKNGVAPPNATGVSTAAPVPYSYNYDGSGVVRLVCGISNASTKITSFKINGTEYASRFPQSDVQILENVRGARWMEDVTISDIPFAENYDIAITAEPHDLMGGFGWNYLSEEDAGGSADRITHGTLTFVMGEYGGVTYNSVQEWETGKYNGVGVVFEWKDGIKNYSDAGDAWGSAAFPKGAKITMKGGMNSHLQAEFVAVEDIVSAKAEGVVSGDIENLGNAYGEGTMILGVDDTQLTSESREGFEQMASAEGAKIRDVFDINLNNTIYKATSNADDAWMRPVSELSSPVDIKLELKEDYSDSGDIIVLHEHDGAYETIEAEYSASDNTVTFRADSFSNFALATKEAEDGSEDPSVPDEPDESTEEEQDYHLVSDDGNLILEFHDKKDATLRLLAQNLWGITDAKTLDEMGVSKQEYDELTALLADQLKQHGEILALYQIWLENENGEYDGGAPYTLKIRLTDDMKKYKDYKLVDVTGFGEAGFSPDESITLKVEGDYLVASVDHLGLYALAGKSIPAHELDHKTDSKQTNTASAATVATAGSPKTGDESNLLFFYVLACAAMLMMVLLQRREE